MANEVETEQLVHDATSSIHASGRYTSYLQLRGSVPSFWSQDLDGIKPKPSITSEQNCSEQFCVTQQPILGQDHEFIIKGFFPSLEPKHSSLIS